MPYNGIDIIEIGRIRRALDRFGERFLNRIYTAEERKLCGGRVDTLAARFASKEAVMKLLGTGRRGVSWRDIETLAHPSGKPRVNLYGGARREAEKLGIREIAVSLAHSREYAIASAVGGGTPQVT
ncbi:MAG: holo-ACP synthase [Chloroflexota bacterium]